MLIECPECGKKISSTCEFCIHCGFELKKSEKQQPHKTSKVPDNSTSKQSEFINKAVLRFMLVVLLPVIIMIAIFKFYSCITLPVYLLFVYRKTKIGKKIISLLFKGSKHIYKISKKVIKRSSVLLTEFTKEILKYLTKHKKGSIQVAVLIFLIAISFPLYYKFFRFGYVFEPIPAKPESMVRFQEGNYKWGKWDGLVKNYNEKKQLISEVMYQKGKKEGEFTVFYPKDDPNERVIQCVSHNKNDKLDGPAICYYQNGQRASEGSFKEGKTEGKSISYYENGEKKREEIYKNGKIEGPVLEYYSNGQKKAESFLKDDKKEGTFISYYDDGQKKFETKYANGKEEGEAISYHENGTVKSVVLYKKGVLEGDAIEFHKNGKKYKEFTYVNGKTNGKGQIYNEKGELEKVINIRNGSLEGETLFYTPDGKVYKTVVYKNGKARSVKIGKENIRIAVPELLEQDLLLIETKNRKEDDYDFLLYIGYDKSKTHLAEIVKKIRERKKYYYLYDDLASLRFDWTVSKYDKVASLAGCYCIKNEHLISTHYTDTKDGITSSYLSKKKCTDCDLMASANKIREDEEAAAKQLAEQKRYYEEKGKKSDFGRERCKYLAKMRLTYPSSADFSWATSSEPIDGYRKVVMTGEFKALNGFGAKLPYEYRCVTDVRTEEVLDLSVYAR